ncbi:hypothetical protein M0804_013839 [Polistes exclamans]|nr:hypothetical protein M0804_013839 [Polistes exclamans]
MTNVCAMNALCINNTFYPNKPKHKLTYENTKGHKLIMANILTNRNIDPTKTLGFSELSSANTGTNHNLVHAKIRKNTLNTKTKPKEKQTSEN